MDYKWARDFSLELLDQYSIAGQPIPETYNNQADYIRRIPKLLNDAQVYVATTAGRIRAVEELKNLSCDDNGQWLVYTLPGDFWQLCSGGLIRYNQDGELERSHLCHIIGSNRIAVPKGLSADAAIEYYRLPRPVSGEDEEEPLDNSVPAQMTLPYYVAAHLCMHDNAYAYQALMNEFEAKIGRLVEPPTVIYGTVADAYDADGNGGGY